jgi:hypothetical protein
MAMLLGVEATVNGVHIEELIIDIASSCVGLVG